MQIKKKKKRRRWASSKKRTKQPACYSLPLMLQLPRDRESLWLDTALGASLGHDGVNSCGPHTTASVSTEPGLSPHRRHTAALSKRYSHLISRRGLARVNRTSHNSAGAQMKAGWPDKPAKYARAAGFAFVFLLFINVCIYLFFGPRVGRGWEPGVGQTGGLVCCRAPKAQWGGFSFFGSVVFFNFYFIF